MRGLIAFGTNLLLSHSDSLRGREALRALDFFAHVDLFMTPTAELADVVLPASTPFEREALKIGFESSAEAQSFVQLRPPSCRRQGSRGRIRRSCSIWRVDWGSARISGMATSRLATDISWVRPVSPWRICGRTPRASAFRWRRTIARSPWRSTVASMALPRRPDWPSSMSERFLDHGYPPLPEFEEPLVSQPPARSGGPASRWCRPARTDPHFPRVAAPGHRAPAQALARSRGGASSSGGGRPRDRRGRLGGDRNPERIGARSRPLQCFAGCGGGGGPAWMVARMRRRSGRRATIHSVPMARI